MNVDTRNDGNWMESLLASGVRKLLGTERQMEIKEAVITCRQRRRSEHTLSKGGKWDICVRNVETHGTSEKGGNIINCKNETQDI